MIEEGKGHFEVSLVIGLAGDGLDPHLSANDEDLSTQTQSLLDRLNHLVYNMRLAGGSVFHISVSKLN
jgi:CRISPR-associated protein Csy2